MNHVLGYVVAIAAAAILAPVIFGALCMITVPLVKLFRPLGRFSLVFNFVMSATSMCVAMTLFIWCLGQMRVTAAFLMFVIPWLGVISNDFRRIDAAKEGRWLSRLGQFMARHTDGIDYRGVVLGEYGSLAGNMLGLWLPVFAITNMRLW